MVDSMNVYIYPNEPADDGLARDAAEALDAATNQTMDYFSNNGENIGRSINIRDDYPEVVTDESGPPGPERTYIQKKDEIIKDFRLWRRDNNRQQTGVHLLVTDIPDGEGGGLSTGYFGGAWRNPPNAIATKTSEQSISNFKNLCIHECYHLFINIGSVVVGAGGARADHVLGEVLSDGPDAGKITPMLNGYYDQGFAAKGECDNTGGKNGYSMTLSDCALEKTLKSYREQGNLF